MMHRRGFTLSNTLVVMAMSGVIMTVVSTLLFAMLKAERRTFEHLAESHVRLRLSRVFREDVHRARSAQVSGEGRLLLLSLADGNTIEYRPEQQSLVRVSGRHREDFEASLVNVRFDKQIHGSQSIIHLNLRPPAHGSTARVQEFQAEARLGRDSGSDSNPAQDTTPGSDS